MKEANIDQWNPICKAGDDFIRYLQVIDPNTDLPVTDYTGWQFFATAKEDPTADPLFELTVGDGITFVTVGGQEFVRLKVSREITQDIQFDLAPGPGGKFPQKKFLIDVVAQDSAGDQQTALEGEVTFRYRVTS